MCRSIKVLRRPAQPTTSDEISAAALQFVRKVSGFQKPSQANAAVFDAAVKEVAAATQRLLDKLPEAKAANRRPKQVEGAEGIHPAPASTS
jgi:hypothetical protein